MKIKAIILAAGRGKRMGLATKSKPKCLTYLCGRTLLDWQLDALKGAGIHNIGIVLGYLGHLVPHPGLTRFSNPNWPVTNMVASLEYASAWLTTSSCVVSYSDIAYPPNTIRELIQAHGDIVVPYLPSWRQLWEARFPDPLSDAETFRTSSLGRLEEIGRRPASYDEVLGQYMGLIKFSPEGWAQAEAILIELPREERLTLDMTSLLSLLIKNGQIVNTIPVRDSWYEVDNESDIAVYESIARQKGSLF